MTLECPRCHHFTIFGPDEITTDPHYWHCMVCGYVVGWSASGKVIARPHKYVKPRKPSKSKDKIR